ncbi:hypothetical protein CR513_58054, partial [Mucuna pruriens]
MKMHQLFCNVESKLIILLMRCLLVDKTDKWAITKWGGRHMCMNVMSSQDHNKLDSELICSCILAKNLKFSFCAWKAKQKIVAWVFGDRDDSCDLLPRWLERMVQCYSESTYKLETDDFVFNNQVDNYFCKFQCVFLVFRVSL